MGDLIYYGMLAVFAFVAIQSFRNGHFIVGMIMLGVAAWIFYSHEQKISYSELKEDLYQSIDEKARKRYDSGLKSQAFEQNASEVK